MSFGWSSLKLRLVARSRPRSPRNEKFDDPMYPLLVMGELGADGSMMKYRLGEVRSFHCDSIHVIAGDVISSRNVALMPACVSSIDRPIFW